MKASTNTPIEFDPWAQHNSLTDKYTELEKALMDKKNTTMYDFHTKILKE